MTTTYVERSNTNAEVFRRANETIQNETEEGKTPKKITPFVTTYLNSRMKRLTRISKMSNEHPVKHITFGLDQEGKIVPWTPANRRVGRPRFKRVTETINNIWDNTKHKYTHLPQTFDKENLQQHEANKTEINGFFVRRPKSIVFF